MNIWTILQTIRNTDSDSLSYEFIREVNTQYATAEARERLRNTINCYMNRLGTPRTFARNHSDDDWEWSWVTCDVSGWVFPRGEIQYGVGTSEDVCFYSEWMENNHPDVDYVFAQHTSGDSGYCRRDYVYWVEGEDCYVTDQLYCRSYRTCPNCDEVFHGDLSYSVWSERNDELYCSDTCCSEAGGYDEDEDDDYSSSNPIHSYGTRIEHVLRMNLEHKKRYFGLEIEQEFPGETPSAHVRWAIGNICYLGSMSIWKSDGSLNNGAELVTLPKPLDYWQKPNPIQDLCDNRQWRKVARAHDTTTCGLHIHVSRSSIPEPVIAKVIYLMNEPCMREITALVARRAPTVTYCTAVKKRWHSDQNCVPKEFYDYNKRENVPVHPWNRARPAKDITKRQSGQSGRYTPVNLTQHTLEFRIFRGTLKWTTIQASIEFCEAVISYCTQMGPARLNDVDFTAWLKSSVTRKTYPALRDYLESRTILPTRRKKPVDIVTDVTLSEPDPEPEVVEPIATWTFPPVCPYGVIEPARVVDRMAFDEWESVSYGNHFHEDRMHWYVSAEAVDRRGWLGAVPIRRYDSDETITVPLVAGQTWRCPDDRTSLTIVQ